METGLPVYIGEDAISNLIHYCEDNQIDQFILVADQNTYPALGKKVEDALTAREFDVETVILTGKEVIANEYYLLQVLVRADRKDRTYLAVGSGTITDITRFVSHRTKSSFISIPTAPSVDGFTSIGAPLVIKGLKQTIISQPPLAVFADLTTLRSAPQRLIASGFGDMLGKFTSLADWKLGQLLWDEPYDAKVAQRSQKAVENCVDYAEEIGHSSAEGIRRLMAGLIESGLCMLEFGSSRPASGAEHHCSHYLEMKLLQENRPAILHGAKVGFATILIAERYEKIKQLSRRQAIKRLKTAAIPDREQEIQCIKAAYGPLGNLVCEAQAPFLNLSEHDYGLLKQKIIDHWADIQDIATKVPTSQQITGLLSQAGGPIEAKVLGLKDKEVEHALEYSHYLRNRFTVSKLGRILQMMC